MPSLNKVMLIGNLTRDPELRHTPRGTAVTEMSLAINRSWRDEQGNKQEEVTFVDVTLWGRTAEVAQAHLAKGHPVFIEGRLTLETWDDKQTGQKRSRLKVVGESFQFLTSGEAARRGKQDPAPAATAEPRNMSIPSNRAASQTATADHLDEPDDLPF